MELLVPDDARLFNTASDILYLLAVIWFLSAESSWLFSPCWLLFWESTIIPVSPTHILCERSVAPAPSIVVESEESAPPNISLILSIYPNVSLYGGTPPYLLTEPLPALYAARASVTLPL